MGAPAIKSAIRPPIGEAREKLRQRSLPLRPAGPDTVSALLAWYDAEARTLPWRYGRRKKADSYRVWLSEIMLQQTTIKAVIPYFEKFTARWPTVEALAAASQEEVLQMWAGLGYYSRARNLKKCADAVVLNHGSVFPASEDALRTLPGIGPYTAAAIAAIAFGQKATPVDGNIERVVSRLFSVRQPLPTSKREIKRLAETLTPSRRAGDFAQAMMDLGSQVCSPKRPSCLMCPLQQDCASHAQGLEDVIPYRLGKAERPVRHGFAFLALREDGCVLLRQRAEAGLLGGMLEVPSTPWGDDVPPARQALRGAPVSADWWQVPGTVVHVFTHFRLELKVYRALVPEDVSLTFWAEADRCRWVKRRDLGGQALPSLMKKVIAHGLKEG